MKKTINILISLGFLFFIANISIASGAILNGGTNDELKVNTELVKQGSGFGEANIGSIIATLIQAGLGLLAAIFLVLMIIAGFQWMTAGGNEAQVKKAQDTIKTAVIGLIIVLAAYAITYFIFKFLPFSSGATGNTGNNGGMTGN